MGLKALLVSDLHRITGTTRGKDFARQFVLGETFRYVAVLRVAAAVTGRPGLLAGVGSWLARAWLRRLRIRLGINVPCATRIGPGFYIGHAGGIVVNAAARIGRDCNISHNVTIGVANGGRNPGVPTIGDRVYVGPGAIIIGGIHVGDDVAIGASAVVIEDVPNGATVVGNPGRILLGRGSADYVHRTTEDIVASPPVG